MSIKDVYDNLIMIPIDKPLNAVVVGVSSNHVHLNDGVAVPTQGIPNVVNFDGDTVSLSLGAIAAEIVIRKVEPVPVTDAQALFNRMWPQEGDKIYANNSGATVVVFYHYYNKAVLRGILDVKDMLFYGISPESAIKHNEFGRDVSDVQAGELVWE